MENKENQQPPHSASHSKDSNDKREMLSQEPSLVCRNNASCLLAHVQAKHLEITHKNGKLHEDISQLENLARQHAAELEQTNARLREQAENLASIFTALDSIGLIVADLSEEDATISMFSIGSEKLFGFSQEEAVGQSIALIYPPGDERIIPKRARRLAAGESMQSFNMNLRRKTGECFPVVVSIHPFAKKGGRCTKAVGVFRDITEMILVQNQLEALNKDLERKVEQRTLELQATYHQLLHAEKLSAIGKLSASIAHEFNNPLQGILTILNGLKKRAVMDEEDRRLLEAAIGEGVRIKELILTLQEFNRPTSGKKMVMDLHKTIDSVLLLHKNELRSKNVSLLRDFSERLPQILAVPDQIKQVLLNLLSNATDACHTPAATITVSTWQEGDRVAFEVRDTGIGINPDDMSRIFEPFFTTKPEVKGTGLGLPVIHGIVKKHHGEIRVASEQGRGSAFTVLLPIDGGK